MSLMMTDQKDFNPRPPRGGRRHMPKADNNNCQFQSTPPARGATRTVPGLAAPAAISIHAPREGGDDGQISARCPVFAFQSTPPARGATRTASCKALQTKDFNPRPPRGGRLLRAWHPAVRGNFNPRPPRGGRLQNTTRDIIDAIFQSTPPARGATRCSRWAKRPLPYFNPRPPRGGRLPVSAR